MNRLEKKALTQINSVNEISLAGILGKLFFSGKAKRLFKTIDKDIKKDPELKAAFIDMHRHHYAIVSLILQPAKNELNVFEKAGNNK